MQHQKTVESLRQSKENDIIVIRQKLEISENSLKETLDKIYQMSRGNF